MQPTTLSLPTLCAAHSCRQRAYLVTLLLVLGLLSSLGRPAHAEIKITFDLKDGDKIADVAAIVAHVQSPDGIDKVEFRVDDQLRYTSVSTPYEYKWDTIVDTEGKHSMTVTAYDANGQPKRVMLSLEIDNELPSGVDALAQKAQDALAAKDIETARRYSRRALKAEPTNLAAGRVLAGLYAANGEYGRAADTLEKAKNIDASSDSLLELASYRMHYALLPENAAKFITAVQSANELRHKAADMAVAETRKHNTEDNTLSHQAIGDALLNAGHIQDAIDEYAKSANADNPPISSVARLALAYMYSRQYRRVTDLLEPLHIGKKDDAPTRAIYALILIYEHHEDEARKVVAPDLADHVPASLIVASYADTMLDKHKDALGEATDAVSLTPDAGDAHYALAMATLKPVDSQKALENALSLAPFQPGPYLDYAARVALTKRQDRYDSALDITDFVLKMDPQSMNARLIQALIYLQTKRNTNAKPILENLYKEDSKAADVLLGLATYCNVLGNGGLTGTYMEQARKIDLVRFSLQQPTTPLECLQLLNRKLHYRADPFLTPATLYPPK